MNNKYKMKTLTIDELNIGNLIYLPPKENTDTNSMLSNSKYKDTKKNHTLKINLPMLKFNRIFKKRKIYYLELQLNENNDDVYNFFSDLDEYNINMIKNNYNLWFDSNLDGQYLEQLEKMYDSIINPQNDNEKNPTIRFSINLSECLVLDQYEKPMKISEIKENNQLLCTLKNKGLRFFHNICYHEWEVIKINIYPEYYCLLSSDVEMSNDNSSVNSEDDELLNV